MPKTLNKHEDLVVKEMSNRNSPMHKDVSKWTDRDLNKALSSPSFKYNYTLQNKAKQSSILKENNVYLIRDMQNAKIMDNSKTNSYLFYPMGICYMV